MGHPLLSTEDLMQEFGVSRDTIYRWNHLGTGPTRVRVGRHVRYRRADVDAWIAANTIVGKSCEGGGAP